MELSAVDIALLDKLRPFVDPDPSVRLENVFTVKSFGSDNDPLLRVYIVIDTKTDLIAFFDKEGNTIKNITRDYFQELEPEYFPLITFMTKKHFEKEKAKLVY